MKRAPWNETHRDLDRALSMCELSPLEQVLMCRARELSYARARLRGEIAPLLFRINVKRLAEEVGCKRERLQEAKARLKYVVSCALPQGVSADDIK